MSFFGTNLVIFFNFDGKVTKVGIVAKVEKVANVAKVIKVIKVVIIAKDINDAAAK